MNYIEYAKHYVGIDKSGTRAEFIERMAHYNRDNNFNLTSEDVNEKLNNNDAEYNINEIPEDQAAQRKALTMELRQKMYNRYADRHLSQMPDDRKQYRYVHDLMLKTGTTDDVGEYNNDFYNKLAAKDETRDKKFVINEHYKLLKQLEDSKPEELLNKELTDREIVDNFEKIHTSDSTVLQFQNMTDNFPELNTLPDDADEEMKEQFNEIHRIMDKYTILGHGFDALNGKLSCIESDPYSVIDINDLVSHKIASDVFNGKYKAGNDDCHKYFSNLAGTDHACFTGEFTACRKLFSDSGVKEEDLMYNLYDRDGNIIESNKKFDIGDAREDIAQNPRYSVKVFDKNNPENSLTVYGDAKPRIMNSLNADEASLKKAADDLKPGVIKSFIHNYISKSFFKEDFEKYEKAKSAYDARTLRARTDAKKNPEAEQKNKNSLEEAKAAKGRIKEAQVEKIMRQVANMPHKTPKDFEFHNAIRDLANDDSLDKTRTFLAGLNADQMGEVYGMFMNGKNIGEELPKIAGDTVASAAPKQPENAKENVANKGDKVVSTDDQPKII